MVPWVANVLHFFSPVPFVANNGTGVGAAFLGLLPPHRIFLEGWLRRSASDVSCIAKKK